MTKLLLANGLAGNRMLQVEDLELNRFTEALCDILPDKLARMLAADGEGATKLLEIRVRGAENDSDPYHCRVLLLVLLCAKPPLRKRCKLGTSYHCRRLFRCRFQSNTVISGLVLYGSENGTTLPFSEAEAWRFLSKEVVYTLDLGMGKGKDTMYPVTFLMTYFANASIVHKSAIYTPLVPDYYRDIFTEGLA